MTAIICTITFDCVSQYRPANIELGDSKAFLTSPNDNTGLLFTVLADPSRPARD